MSVNCCISIEVNEKGVFPLGIWQNRMLKSRYLTKKGENFYEEKNDKYSVVAFMIIGSIIWSTETSYQAATDELELEEVLSSYFAEREAEFISESEMDVQTYGITMELDRRQVIEEWKNNLDIEVVNVDISYEVGDVLEENNSEIQFMLYEWVNIEYKCNGYDTVDVMGFGTDHIMTVSKESNELYIISDTYSEITGYEIGAEEELAILNCENDIVELDSDFVVNEEIEPMSVVVQPAYNKYAAINYSNTWCGVSTAGNANEQTPSKYNPAYYYYDNDCCNSFI